MKTLDRYLTGTFLKNFALAALALTALLFFQTLVAELMHNDFPAEQIIVHDVLNIPWVLSQMIPPAVLVAMVFTLSGFSRSNELVAMFSSGISLQRIVASLASMTFIVCCFGLILQDRILPPFYKKRATHYWREMKGKADFFLDFKQDKIWYRSGNLIYNLKTFDQPNQLIRGMSVYTFNSDFVLTDVLDAQRASFTPEGWRLMDGTATRFEGNDPFPQTRTFERVDLKIAETPKDFQEIEKEVDGLRLWELYRYIQRIKTAGADTKAYEVKFHARISVSFLPLVMGALGVPFSLRRRREGGAGKDLGYCVVLSFFYWLFHSMGLSLGTNGALPPALAAWLPSTIFAVLAVTLIARQKN